jgi:hypothetical protein
VEEPRGTLTATDFESLLRHPAERHPATALLATLTEVIPKLHPINLDEWGVSRADRLPLRSEDPLRVLVQRLTALFGVEEAFDVMSPVPARPTSRRRRRFRRRCWCRPP